MPLYSFHQLWLNQLCFDNFALAILSQKYDIAIVGGGIVGLAVGQKLIIDNPNLKYVLVEKETQLGRFKFLSSA